MVSNIIASDIILVMPTLARPVLNRFWQSRILLVLEKKTTSLNKSPILLLEFNIGGNFFNIIKYERLFMLSLVYSNLKVKIVTLNFLL